MLINFLGKKEKLKYEVEKSFTLRLNDIEQFYYLLETKVNKEAYTNIQVFSVTFLFQDKTTRTINTIESLNKYNETRDVIPISTTLTWHIVIDFPSSQSVETQKIELSFNTNTKNEIGNIILNIEHTNQSWGIEVLNLLKNQIIVVSEGFSKKYEYAKWFKSIVTNKSILTGAILGVSFLMILTMTSTISFKSNTSYPVLEHYKKNNITGEDFEAYKFISNNIPMNQRLESINNFIDNDNLKKYLAEYVEKELIEEEEKRKSFRLNVFSLIVIWLLIYVYINKYIKHHYKNSFILTTNRVKSIYKKYHGIANKVEYYSISTIIFTVVMGLVINLFSKYIML